MKKKGDYGGVACLKRSVPANTSNQLKEEIFQDDYNRMIIICYVKICIAIIYYINRYTFLSQICNVSCDRKSLQIKNIAKNTRRVAGTTRDADESSGSSVLSRFLRSDIATGSP